MLKQQDIVIDAFENRVMQLITITNITKLPQWTDTDVLGAECLLKAYRKTKTIIDNAGNEINIVAKTVVEELAKTVIESASALGVSPMQVLSDFCDIISDGDSVKYKQLYNDVHQVIFEQRDTIPFLIEEPEKVDPCSEQIMNDIN